ncbi:DinB family protein [Heyndrickxia acidicola]|uniref:DinB family protein n=1 Tax=Heyndrickxia acidicola TaxID=209389 RepID=UPI000A3F45E9
MSKQFELTRKVLISFIENLDEDTAGIQPRGFNNTIQWHIGHVLVSAESFMYGYPKKSSHIPESYHELFKMGTKPGDWNGNVPSMKELTELIRNQTERINQLPDEFFTNKLPFTFPFGNIETFGDLYGFMLYHEADHIGQMKAIKRMIEA